MNWKTRLNLEYAKPTKELILLGGSGSIGTTTLEYLRRNSSIRLKGVSVHRSIHKLLKIIEEFNPEHIAITDEKSYDQFKNYYSHSKLKIYKGVEGLRELITNAEADTVLTAIVGSIGIQATIEAIQLEKKICLANKETLITAGPLILRLLKEYRAPLIPVDSEHNAAFQLLQMQDDKNIDKLILTASGGPFREYSIEQLKQVTKKDVLNHPTWDMGPKITVDSAGLINKGLEIIEAHFLFGISYDNLQVKIHKDSYVHALIRTKDGSFFSSISTPNMIFPIAHSLHYPEPLPFSLEESSEPEQWPSLEFQSVDTRKYPGFALCIQAGKIGKTAPAILNAANEVAVELFLKDQIHFLEIPVLIRSALENIPVVDLENLDILLEIDQRTREFVLSNLNIKTLE